MPLKHNFSLASSRDRIVHGATRPGYAKDNEVAGGVADQDVEAWCSFMKEQVSGALSSGDLIDSEATEEAHFARSYTYDSITVVDHGQVTMTIY